MKSKMTCSLLDYFLKPLFLQLPWCSLIADYQIKSRGLIALPHRRIDGPRLAWARWFGAFKRNEHHT